MARQMSTLAPGLAFIRHRHPSCTLSPWRLCNEHLIEPKYLKFVTTEFLLLVKTKIDLIAEIKMGIF